MINTNGLRAETYPRPLNTMGIAQTGMQQPMQQTGMVQNTAIPQQPQTQQYGLSGAEQAVQAGVGSGVNALSQGQNNAIQSLNYGNKLAQNQIAQGTSDINSGTQSALSQLRAAQSRVDTSINKAVQPLQGYSDTGQQSSQLQAALSGALGQQAQQEAYNNFNNSPGQQWLVNQGEQSLINQGAATGGLGGGDIRKELLKYGQGMAQQDYQNQFNNLGQVTNTGLNAANSIGNLRGQQAGLSASLGGQGAQISSQGGNNIASLLGQGAGISANLGSQGANIYNQTGTQAASMLNNAGNNIANARMATGQNISNNIANTTTGMSNLINQQGGGLADIIGSGGTNIANLLSGAGVAGSQQQEQLATLLANLSTGQASQLAGQQAGIGQAQAAGSLRNADIFSNLVNQGTGMAAYGGYLTP